MKPRTRRPRKASPAQREEALRRRLEDRNAEMEDRYYSEQQKWVQRLNTATTRADKDEAVARLHELNEWFNHIRTRRSQAELEANLRRAARNEEAVYTNIAFMESVHAKSYSNIFMTLADTPTINQAFNWGRQNERLQYKAHRVLDFYKRGNANMRKAASTLLESFLFYSGFYLPLRMAAHSKLTNTADIIRLIIRDEAVHGYYIGYKYQQAVKHLSEDDQAELEGEVVDLLLDLMDNEEHYTRELYDPLGWTEDVLAFLRYNANKALNNLGYEGMYPSDMCQFNPAVMTSLNPGADENHDFFSGSGSSYVIGTAEDTTDEDWAW